ncbi:hypothetical protein JVU11DRAFT_6055 [Chiua virens]|nr:hypothetical protein JVU11DRAFT_6055 [Chiua virens]
MHAIARPVDDDDDDDDDDCWSTTVSPSAVILAQPPTPRPSPSQIPHATLPIPHRDQTPVILGSVFGVFIALVVFVLATRYVIRRRRDPFKDPRFQLRPSKRRLSDESWVSPTLSDIASPPSQDLDVDTEFGNRPVRVPPPAYIAPISPSPSTEPLTSSPRLSRLLSSTFRDSCQVDSPARPSTAYLSCTASLRFAGTRSRADVYEPHARDTISTTTTADPDTVTPSASASTLQPAPVLKLRMSDASEHARYRLREMERQHERQLVKERFSTESVTSMDDERREFRLRDSETVLREIGW